MPKSYEDYMKKAHGALILERENEIILELRATRNFLQETMNAGFEEVNIRLDTTDEKLNNIEILLQKLLSKQ